MDQMQVPSPPSHLSVTGLYDVDYRIVVSCRNGTLCTLKRMWTEAKTIAVLDSQTVGLIRREKTVTVATMSQQLVRQLPRQEGYCGLKVMLVLGS